MERWRFQNLCGTTTCHGRSTGGCNFGTLLCGHIDGDLFTTALPISFHTGCCTSRAHRHTHTKCINRNRNKEWKNNVIMWGRYVRPLCEMDNIYKHFFLLFASFLALNSGCDVMHSTRHNYSYTVRWSTQTPHTHTSQLVHFQKTIAFRLCTSHWPHFFFVDSCLNFVFPFFRPPSL